MMRDGDRIDHMLSFTRRCIEILDGVDKAQFLDSIDKQESLELNFLHETKPGDTLSVFVHRDSDDYYSQITNSQGQSVTACIRHI